MSIFSAERGTRVTRYAKSQREAKQKIRELQQKIAHGVNTVSASMPLRVYLREWLELVKPGIRLKTYEEYESLIRVHLFPGLGHIKLDKLTPEQINRAWAQMLEKGHSASVVAHCHVRRDRLIGCTQEESDLYKPDPVRCEAEG